MRRIRQIPDFMMLYVFTQVHELELRDLQNALTKLPSTDEFKAFKSYLTEGKEIVEELEPIKKVYANYLENKKRMEEYGFIG
jgi:hypothetical protein